MSNANLPARQVRFVEEYLIDLNATQAAVRAGYSPRTANKVGPRLLVNVGIQEAITDAVQARSQRTQVDQDRVVEELARIAFSDMNAYVTWGPDGVTLTASDELLEGASRAVAEVAEVLTEGGRTVKFKLHDKKAALDSLAKHLGMYVERKEVSGPAGGLLGISFMQLAKEAAEEEDPRDGRCS